MRPWRPSRCPEASTRGSRASVPSHALVGTAFAFGVAGWVGCGGGSGGDLPAGKTDPAPTELSRASVQGSDSGAALNDECADGGPRVEPDVDAGADCVLTGTDGGGSGHERYRKCFASATFECGVERTEKTVLCTGAWQQKNGVWELSEEGRCTCGDLTFAVSFAVCAVSVMPEVYAKCGLPVPRQTNCE